MPEFRFKNKKVELDVDYIIIIFEYDKINGEYIFARIIGYTPDLRYLILSKIESNDKDKIIVIKPNKYKFISNNVVLSKNFIVNKFTI